MTAEVGLEDRDSGVVYWCVMVDMSPFVLVAAGRKFSVQA